MEPCRGFDCEQLAEDGGVDEQAKQRLALSIVTVTVDGNPSRKVRQGFGGAPSNGTTAMHLTGEQLDTVTDVTIGDGPNALPGVIASKTSTELSFTVSIRHGASIGPQLVKATAPDGSATFSGAVEITPITAAPAGSDALDVGLDSTGTDNHPVRSMAKAITLAAAGDTVFLKNGTYDMDRGETFAKPTKHQVIPNVPPDVTIKGESTEGTLLQGPTVTNCTNSENIFIALATTESARIETLRIAGFCSSGISSDGELTVKDVAIRDTGSGVNAGPNATIDSVDISGTRQGIVLRNLVGTIAISNSHLHHNNVAGISGSNKATLDLTASEIDHNGPGDGVTSSGGIVVRGPTTITNVNIHDNKEFGINIDDVGATGQLDITKSRFWANRSAAIFVGGPASVKVRTSSFEQDSKEVHVNSGSTKIDLGTPDDRGNNHFAICATCDGVFDTRPAPVEGLSTITLTGNAWSGGDPPAGCSQVDHPKTKLPPRYWHIEHPGTCSSNGNVIIN